MLEANNGIDFTTNNEIPIEEVIAQMEKELQMSGEQHHFKHTIPVDLVSEMAHLLKTIDTGTRVANLFYRIDINSAKATKHLPYYESLAVLAWNRVFQKVWFRRNYKG